MKQEKLKEILITAPCHFGMEAVLKREINDLGYEIANVEDGRVSFISDLEGIAYANIFLRTAERILVKLGSFQARTYEELYQGAKKIELERYMPMDSMFWVTKASSINSALFSPSDIQSIVKKALVDRFKSKSVVNLPETGAKYPLRVKIHKDMVSIYLDTTGPSLHKRGYRLQGSKAPISETLAAAIILLSYWNKDRLLIDPFCGSGTFPIEAALIATNTAPGLKRRFLSETWTYINMDKHFQNAREDAIGFIDKEVSLNIQGFDIDEYVVKNARENAKRAGVDNYIHFQAKDIRELSSPKQYGVIITNPPYGERLEDEDTLPDIYKALGDTFKNLKKFSMYMITSYENAIKYMGVEPTKNRKLYNGMIKTYLYQFIGERPPKIEK